MNLTCGILGKQLSGKSTLFALLTGEKGSDAFGPVNGVAFVKDARITALSDIFKPKKTSYATVHYTDIPGLQDRHGNRSESKILEHVKNTDSLLAVINGFENDTPALMAQEIMDICGDLLINDLIVVENRLAKLKHLRTPEEKVEFALFERLKAVLDEDKPLRLAELKDEEKKAIRGFQFYTLKPIIFVLNLSDELYKNSAAITETCKKTVALDEGTAIISLSAKTEAEIMELPEEDRALFMEDAGLAESALNTVVKATYDLLNLASFFTVGEDEVKAWTIRKDTPAKRAAGEIHSDIERGFIKAEVASYEDFMKHKDLKALRDKGALRLEGKDYIVRDGDIINFKFNV